MRTLVLLRGAPGSGKSTFIKNNKLESYTISSDNIRLLYSSPELSVSGKLDVSQTVNSIVWKRIAEILEVRMLNGDFTIVDACHANNKDFKIYKDLANKYKYRVYVIDFTNVPICICKMRNNSRSEINVVPDYVIDRMYTAFQEQQVPSWAEVIKPDEFEEKIYQYPINLSEFKKIVHFGDIHGSFKTLMKYFDDNPFNEEYCYIFLGDYIDRGPENYKVLEFLEKMTAEHPKNFCLLEGNHERHIRKFINNEESTSNEFKNVTKIELETNGFTQSRARQFWRKLRQCSYYTYNGIEVLACHAGIPIPPNTKMNIVFNSTKSLVNGVGKYEDYDDVASIWNSLSTNQYLVNGHRNIKEVPIDVFGPNSKVFNLEGGVEFGGYLRIVELSHDGWKPIYIECIDDIVDKCNIKVTSVETLVESLRASKFVKEKQLGNGFSSFNFTREAFFNRNWNNQTTKARGLFIDTDNNEILARSYEKFFNIDEVHSTKLENLKENLKFPLTAYLKENGFLGILSYSKKTGNLFIASKSQNTGEFAKYFKDILYKYDVTKLQKWLMNNDYSLVFEVIDVENDPHIIEYEKSKLVLLDAIKNDIVFEKMDYQNLIKLSEFVGIDCKEKRYVINNWDEFENFYKYWSNNINTAEIEGFVIEDSNGFLFKLKTAFYNYWKHLRAELSKFKRFGKMYKPNLGDDTINNVWSKLLDNPDIENIIELRKIVENSKID